MAHDLGQQIMNGLIMNGMVVVQHQDEVLLNVHQIVEQTACNRRGRRCGYTAHNAQRVVGHCRKQRVQSLGQIGRKHNQVVVMLVQRQPGFGNVAGFQPCAQQRRLAIAGRRKDECQTLSSI